MPWDVPEYWTGMSDHRVVRHRMFTVSAGWMGLLIQRGTVSELAGVDTSRLCASEGDALRRIASTVRV